MTRRLAVLTIAAAIALVVLIGLGVWQLQRKAWKEGLLADLQQAATQEPLPIAELFEQTVPGQRMFRRVTLNGRFTHATEFHVWLPRKDGTFWRVVTPFVPVSGARGTDGLPEFLVIRGTVPAASKSAATRTAGQTTGELTITGRIIPASAPGLFAPAPDTTRNEWLSLDLPAMHAQLDLKRSTPSGVAPFFIELQSPTPAGGLPKPDPIELNLRNDHLGYALTWFGIALTLIGVWLALVLRERRAPV